MVYNLCFHFNSNNLFIFYIYLISVLKLYLFLNETYKFYREFNVELHGTDDDRELMARYNARREESGLAEYDRSVSRLREAVHEASVKRSHDELFVLGS